MLETGLLKLRGLYKVCFKRHAGNSNSALREQRARQSGKSAQAKQNLNIFRRIDVRV